MLNLSGEASPKKGRILALSQGCSVQKDHAEAFILQTQFAPMLCKSKLACNHKIKLCSLQINIYHAIIISVHQIAA